MDSEDVTSLSPLRDIPPSPVLDSREDRNRGLISRIFIGNLKTEATSKEELRDIFGKYGRITEEVVLRKSFGFVQYDNPESAREAIRGENGRSIGGMRIDLNLADNRGPKKPKNQNSRPSERPRENNDRHERNRDHQGGRDHRNQSNNNNNNRKRRSPSPYRGDRDRERNNRQDHRGDRDRDRHQERDDSRHNNKRPHHNNDNRNNNSNNNNNSHQHQQHQNQDNYSRISGYGPVVVQLVSMSREIQSVYASKVEENLLRNLSNIGMESIVSNNNNKRDVSSLLDHAERKGIRYVCILARHNESKNTVSLHILRTGRPREIRDDMNLSSAIDLIKQEECLLNSFPGIGGNNSSLGGLNPLALMLTNPILASLVGSQFGALGLPNLGFGGNSNPLQGLTGANAGLAALNPLLLANNNNNQKSSGLLGSPSGSAPSPSSSPNPANVSGLDINVLNSLISTLQQQTPNVSSLLSPANSLVSTMLSAALNNGNNQAQNNNSNSNGGESSNGSTNNAASPNPMLQSLLTSLISQQIQQPTQQQQSSSSQKGDTSNQVENSPDDR